MLKNLSQVYSLEVYSPVHIGSGKELKKDFDFIIEASNQAFIVDVEKSLEAIDPKSEVFNKYCNTANIEDLVKIVEKIGYSLKNFSKSSQGKIETIQEHLKDAFLKPMIPGSSLKGAIRTALYSTALEKNNLNNKQGRKNDSHLIKQIFGSNPQTDLLRSLKLSDAYFQLESLNLGDIRIANHCNGQLKWKNLTTRKNKENWKESFPLYREILTTHSKSYFILSWDQFLLQKDILSKWTKNIQYSSCIKTNSFNELKKIVNQYALKSIEDELQFFKRTNQKEVVQFYEKLKKEISNKSDSMWLRLGWGLGKRAMTGLTTHEDKLISNKENKKTVSQASKTRRLLLEGESPKTPLGWIQITQTNKKLEDFQNNNTENLTKDQTYESQWLRKTIQKIKMEHNSADDLQILRGKPLAEAWEKSETGEEKTKALKEIIEHWKNNDLWDNPTRKSKQMKLIYEQALKELDQ